MELKELTERVLGLLNVVSPEELTTKLFEVVKNNDFDVYEKFLGIVQDLSIDWLQMIFQYYLADRKEKKQDYTPKNLAVFMGRLVGEADTITDLCAGSGALTIQKWNMNPRQEFELYEIDGNVIPFLLFNMAVRNIECIVYHSDVLQQEEFHTYKINKGEHFGKFEEVKK